MGEGAVCRRRNNEPSRCSAWWAWFPAVMEVVTRPPPRPPTDTTPPETTLASSPPAVSNQRRGTFSVTSNDASAVFEVNLNNGPYTQVPGLFALELQQDGEFQVIFRARDAAGNTDPTPAIFRWTIDTPGARHHGRDHHQRKIPAPRRGHCHANRNEVGTFEASRRWRRADTAVVSPWSLTSLLPTARGRGRSRPSTPLPMPDPTPATFAWHIDSTMPTARVIFPTPVSVHRRHSTHVRGTAQDAKTASPASESTAWPR